MFIIVKAFFHHIVQSRPLFNCKYANPQKINPKNESNNEDIKLSKSQISKTKKVFCTIEERDDASDDKGENPDSDDDGDPDTPSDEGVTVSVFGVAEDAEEEEAGGDRGVDYAEHDEYAIFLNVGSKARYAEPTRVRMMIFFGGGPVVYCPNFQYIIPPARLKTIISETVTATRTFGKSLGSFISAINEGRT
jgi:hypothetical protein